MELKLCRICGKQNDSYIHIFKTDGLQNKIETCLPIVVLDKCPLPDTVCTQCVDTIDNFYNFIKTCLQNIIVLEAQYEIIESCLKTKRKIDKSVQIEASELYAEMFPKLLPVQTIELDDFIPILKRSLVDYACSSDSELESESESKSKSKSKIKTASNDIINEIVERKCLKRKHNDEEIAAECKIARIETGSGARRKNRQPKKVEYHSSFRSSELNVPEQLLSLPADISITREPIRPKPPPPPAPLPPLSQQQQTTSSCLLCDQQAPNLLALTSHMYETHGIDLAQVFAGGNGLDESTQTFNPNNKNRKIPELVKISEMRRNRKQKHREFIDIGGPPVLEPQLQLKSDGALSVSIYRNQFTCSECPEPVTFHAYKEYSTHRRAQHQIFHCDLCPKYYGRNSHLWKHVNRVHKGHPSITCQQCYKTSASKYHLAQHINKMHSTKSPRVRMKDGGGVSSDENDTENFLTQKFEAFDFKSVRQSFLKQDLLNKRRKYVSILKRKVATGEESVPEKKFVPKWDVDPIAAPKEIDASSDLYTNIITNYTPPTNEGPYKCTKCFKGFQKKHLLKKHKKNCRPRLQKDLLTRCKSCSRIFKDRQSLAKHLVNYHSEYTCEICHVAVQSKCEIVSHIRFTHPNSELHCQCGQILRSRSDLAKHKLEHRESHVCQFCGDALPTKIKLKMHILSLHRKILSLSCGICLKLFETQHILKDHVRLVHRDQLQPLTSCTVCGKNYGSKWKTYDHLNKSHGRIFRACKVCLDVFETERDLQTHFEREHLNTGGGSKMNAQKEQIKVEEEEIQQRIETPPNGLLNFVPDSSKNAAATAAAAAAYVINKLSLLENRLLGKKLADEDLKRNKKRHIQRPPKRQPAEYQDDQPPELVPERKPAGNGTNELVGGGGGDSLLQNSSKRTVYVNSNDPSLCEICLKVWPAKKHLWQHYIRCHKQVAATVCGICLKTNPDYGTLQTHLHDIHPNLLHGCGFGSNFICKICGRYHNASSKLKFHMAIHVGFDESVLLDHDVGNGVDEDQVETKEGEEESDSDVIVDDKDDEEDDDEEEEDDEINEDPPVLIKSEPLEEPDDINYESLIEEVEASTDSEPEPEPEPELETEKSMQPQEPVEEEEEEDEEAAAAATSTSEEDEDEDENESEENDASLENELEQEMLKNMIGENKSVQLQLKREMSDEDEYELNEDVIEEYEVELVDSSNVKTEVYSAPDDDGWMNNTVVKHNELDDAIRSISFEPDSDDGEEEEEEDEEDDDDEREEEEDVRQESTVIVNSNSRICLNDTELETAVGSIL